LTTSLERIDFHTMGQKLAAWRDYFDMNEVEAQLGAGTSAAGSRA
jgi:limonene-1,2-epoxide hydrolase